MSNTVESGVLRGRPFGGVICLIKKRSAQNTRTIHCSDRHSIVGDCIFTNIYLPCVGSVNRQLICE